MSASLKHCFLDIVNADISGSLCHVHRKEIGMWTRELEKFEQNIDCLHVDAVNIRRISILVSKSIRNEEKQLDLCAVGIDTLANLMAGGKKTGLNRRHAPNALIHTCTPQKLSL